MTTRLIGYVDFKLNNFHANVYLDLLRGELKPRGWEVATCWGLDETEGRKWAAEKNVPFAANAKAMADCDAFIVKEVMRSSDGKNHHEVRVRFTRGRTGSVFVHNNGACAFQAMITSDEKTAYVNTGADPIFRDLASLILDYDDEEDEYRL